MGLTDAELRRMAANLGDAWVKEERWVPGEIARYSPDVATCCALAVAVAVNLQNRRGMRRPFDRAGFMRAMLAERNSGPEDAAGRAIAKGAGS